MSEEKKKFKKVKLNYVPAVEPFIPKETIPISSAYLEELDRTIQKRVEQNKAEYNAGIEYIESHPTIYGSNNSGIKTRSLRQNKRH